MKSTRFAATSSAAAAVFAALMLAACSRPDSPAEPMQTYWDAIRLADWQTAWSLERAGADGTDDPYHYYRRMQAAWPVIGVELDTPTVDGRDAEVRVELTRALPIPDRSIPKPESKIDRWRWADGRWWHLEAVVAPSPAPEAPARAAPSGGGEPPPTTTAATGRDEGAEPPSDDRPDRH